MSDQPLSVYQAASQLGISVHTVRRWCKDFSEYLSDGSNPEMGTARRLSRKDMQVLAEVSRLRGDGLSTPLINQRLSETVFSDPTDLQPAQASQGGASAAQTALIVVEAMQSALAPLTARVDAIQTTQDTHQATQDARIDALESSKIKQQLRIEFLESQRQRVDVVFLVAMAFIAGVLVGLAVWWFQ